MYVNCSRNHFNYFNNIRLHYLCLHYKILKSIYYYQNYFLLVNNKLLYLFLEKGKILKFLVK